MYIFIYLFIEGGLKAVIWTDVIQSIVMFVGLFSVIIQGMKTITIENSILNR